MNKSLLILIIVTANCLLLAARCFSQAPEIEWQNTIGGSNLDIARVGCATFDGGYIITGESKSGITGDKTELNIGGTDYWVVKLNPTGEIEWQNTIGGNKDDITFAIQQTIDSGYIVGGHSKSGISGDKTEANLGPSTTNDFWIVKLDATGEIQWQNTIGGSGDEYLNAVVQTPDGGFVLGGYSTSGISGDKTEINFGEGDFWVVKIDSSGNIEWQKTIGGDSIENLESIVLSSDGGYLLGGFSSSGISGNKLEENMGAAATYDYFIVELNATGAIEWQNTIGGNDSDVLKEVCRTFDGGYILGGYSQSDSSGDKTIDNSGAFGTDDYWIVKINSFGSIEWQQVISAPGYDYAFSIKQVLDGGFIIAGFTYSGEGYDKSEDNLGIGYSTDLWIVKLDWTGEIEWENTIWGNDQDIVGTVVQTTDLGYLIAAGSESGLSGDKTEPSYGNYDYWIIKLVTDCTPETEICNDFDDDCNGIRDNGLTFLDYYTDIDFDGFGDMLVAPENSCLEIPGSVTNNYDCNDSASLINPDGIEICNIIDDNCNGLIDDGIVETISISPGGPTTFCQGGSVLLTATYSGTEVQWKKDGVNIPGATSSTYYVTKKATYTATTTSDCGTATSDGIFVNVQKNPPASITAGGPTTFCAGGSVVLTANAGPGLSYQWYKGATPIAGATSINYTATLAGNYKCRVTKTATGCFKNSNVITVSVPCKEEDQLPLVEPGGSITIFPNPATDQLNINMNPFTPDSYQDHQSLPITIGITITDITGKTVATFEITSATMQLNIADLAAGMYFVIANIEGREFIENFIKE